MILSWKIHNIGTFIIRNKMDQYVTFIVMLMENISLGNGIAEMLLFIVRIVPVVRL